MGKNFDKVEISYELITNKRYIYKLCLEKRKEYIEQQYSDLTQALTILEQAIEKIDKENFLIRVGYCLFKELGHNSIHDMIAEINGITALEIVNTLIVKNYISSLQHAADMGIELHKAELALKYNLQYIQDKKLEIL